MSVQSLYFLAFSVIVWQSRHFRVYNNAFLLFVRRILLLCVLCRLC